MQGLTNVFVIDEKHRAGGYICHKSKVPKGAKTKPVKAHLDELIAAENAKKK